MKVLIIHAASAGEVIFSTPLIRAIKTHDADTGIYYVTTSSGKLALEENALVSATYDVKLGVRKLFRELQRHSFDMIIDLDRNFLSYVLTRLTRGRLLYGPKANWLANFGRRKSTEQTHLVERYLRVLDSTNISQHQHPLDFTIPYKDEVPLSWLPEPYSEGYVVLCIQAQYATRKLPVKRMIELCDRINKPIIILGETHDHEAGEQIENFFARTEKANQYEEGLIALNKKAEVYNGCGKFNFHQRASLIKQAQYVFTFDNDCIAIASAFKKYIFSIWGNTILQSGRYPYQTGFMVFEKNNLPCRPCSAKGYAHCPLSHFKCMNDIVFDFYLP